MNAPNRTAQAGDICILLQPDSGELSAIQQRQAALQARFGGRLHEPVHLTCQRFEILEDSQLEEISTLLEGRMKTTAPFPLYARGLLAVEHGFWKTRLLRWDLLISEELRALIRELEGVLGAAGANLHYPASSGWIPTQVTALEGIPDPGWERQAGAGEFPAYLFTARKAIVSRILGLRHFEIIAAVPLLGAE